MGVARSRTVREEYDEADVLSDFTKDLKPKPQNPRVLSSLYPQPSIPESMLGALLPAFRACGFFQVHLMKDGT